MALRYESELPAVEQYWGLFQTTGWNAEYHATPQELVKALAHSWYCIAVYDDERLVGFGRIVTDQVLHAMIYDLIDIVATYAAYTDAIERVLGAPSRFLYRPDARAVKEWLAGQEDEITKGAFV